MRVCLVSRELAPFTGWGVGTYAANMARALADAGHETHVLTAPVPAVAEQGEALFPGIHVHTIERSGPPASLRHVPCRATQGPLAIFQTLRVLHERHAFEYIEFADFYGEGYFAARARRTTSLFENAILAVRLHSPIFVLREANRQNSLDINTACVEHIEREALRGVDLVLSPSRAMIEKACALCAPAISDWIRSRARVLPYPFDAALFGASPPRSPADSKDSGPRTRDPGPPEVLFFGRLEHRKGVHLLVEAAQRLLDEGLNLRVRIVGQDTTTAPRGGSMVEWLRAEIRERWAGAFQFEPNRPREELASLIRTATVCCVPSLWENFPFALLESMSAGARVVGADAGGIPEIIRDGVDGLLFRAGDAASLADALGRALTDAPVRERLATAAPARVHALCDPAGVVRRLEGLVTDVSTSSRSSSAITASPSQPSPESVSVIIPFFNLATFLPQTIASVREQTRLPDEIIVVDDGSTEPEARELIDRLERGPEGGGRTGPESGPPLRVVRQPNRGLSGARNTGFREARSRWVLPLDADDLLAPEFIERALAAASRCPDAALITTWMSCFEDKEGGGPTRPGLLFVPIGFERDMLCLANVASSCTALLDRRIVLEAGGYDESLNAYEDWELHCRLAQRGHAAEVIPEALILNRIRSDSMLRTLTEPAREELRLRIVAKHPGLAPNPDRAALMLAARQAGRQTPARPPLPRALFGRVARGISRLARAGWAR